MCLIGLLSEIAETPVFIGISAFRNKSHNGVTTEAERRQNGGRTEAGPTRGGVWILTAFHNCLPVFPGGESLGFAQFAQFAQMRSLAH